MHRVSAVCRAGMVVGGILGAFASAAAVTVNPDGLAGMMFGNGPVTDIVDRGVFDAAHPQAHRVDLTAEAGKTAPFSAGPVRFSGGSAQVLATLVDLDAAYWFGAQATSPDFLLTNMTVQITFRRPLQALGFDLQCFACDAPDTPTPITAVLLDENGDAISYQQVYPNGLTGTPAGSPRFLGFDSAMPFKSIVLHRDGNWLLANLRYAVQVGAEDARP